MRVLITPEELNKIAPSNKGQIAINRAAALSKICPIYGIDSITVMEDYLANVLHESQELNRLVESLNYSATALISKFGRHRISIVDAYKYGRTSTQVANQKMIGNLLYGGQWGKKNLGNIIGSNDGWELRGTGWMQITGRYLFEKFTTYYNKLNKTNYTIYEIANMLRDATQIELAVHCSCWVFAVEKGLIQKAKQDKVVEIRKKINGGTNGLQEVIGLTAKVKSVLRQRV